MLRCSGGFTTSVRIYKLSAALALTCVAGYVDAMCYLALFAVYTANMSGNSIKLGQYMVRRDWVHLAIRALPVFSFLIGLVLAGIVVELARRRDIQRRVSLALALEVICLVAFMILATSASLIGRTPTISSAALTTLAAVAMGVQNASLRGAGALNIHTTHVTGILTSFSRAMVRWALPPKAPTGKRQSRRRTQIMFFGSLWIIYVAGAAAGTWAWTSIGLKMMWAAVIVVMLVIALDLNCPLTTRPVNSKDITAVV